VNDRVADFELSLSLEVRAWRSWQVIMRKCGL
jgi:hypothetical protein